MVAPRIRSRSLDISQSLQVVRQNGRLPVHTAEKEESEICCPATTVESVTSVAIKTTQEPKKSILMQEVIDKS